MKKSSSRMVKISLAALFVALVTAAVIVYAVDRHKTFYHFAVVEPGVLYRSGTLSNRGLFGGPDRALRKIHERSGFRTIVNLRSHVENEMPWHEVQKRFAEENGIKMYDLQMEIGIPPLPARDGLPPQEEEFLAIVNNPENQPVLVHCEYGVIRTGMMVAVYQMVEMGKDDNRAVFEDLPMFNHKWDGLDLAVNFILNYRRQDRLGDAAPEEPAE